MNLNSEVKRCLATQCVAIIGPRTRPNTALAALINEKTTYACRVLPTPPAASDFAEDVLLLIDAAQWDRSSLDAVLTGLGGRTHHVALINAEYRAEFEACLAWPQLRGIFFRESSDAKLLQGIQAIFAGEYWFPRALLVSHLESNRRRRIVPVAARSPLTRKEQQILALVVEGHTNSIIADRLCVSEHTIKTHVYNLYRKLGVCNRVQATNWAKSHLEIWPAPPMAAEQS